MKTISQLDEIYASLNLNDLRSRFPGRKDAITKMIGMNIHPDCDLSFDWKGVLKGDPKDKEETEQFKRLKLFCKDKGFKIHYPTLNAVHTAEEGKMDLRGKTTGQYVINLVAKHIKRIAGAFKELREGDFHPNLLEGVVLTEDPEGELELRQLFVAMNLLKPKAQ